MITVYTSNVRGFYNGDDVEAAIVATERLLKTQGDARVSRDGADVWGISGIAAQRAGLTDAQIVELRAVLA